MGIIVAKFRKKKTTYEVLEALDSQIKSIEEFGRNTEQTQKKMVGRFVFISVCAYFVSALIFYFYFFPASLSERIVYIIPLILLPFLKLMKNEKKLVALKDGKKKLLDDVMDKETYKVAKKILEKFAPEQVRKNALESTPVRPGTPQLPSTIGRGNYQTGLRYRFPPQTMTPGPSLRPIAGPTPAKPLLPSVQQQQQQLALPTAIPGTPLPLPRSILPKDRSVLDKMVDYLVGDGPSNRYALICRNCSGHNGMALKEEFDYLSFRCCYCTTFNPARKKRPSAPKLAIDSIEKFHSSSETSESERHSDSESGSDSDAIITEPEGQDGNIDKATELDAKNSDTESQKMDVDVSNNEDETDVTSKASTNETTIKD